jgi:hypothetical protein
VAPQPVEQELRVEGDRQLIAHQARLDRLTCLRVLTLTCFECDRAVGEAQPDRRVSFSNEGDPADSLHEVLSLYDGVGGRFRGEERSDLGILTVDQEGRRPAATCLEANQFGAAVRDGQGQGHIAAASQTPRRRFGPERAR